MLINIINRDAEQTLLTEVEDADARRIARSALHLYYSRLARRPLEEEILLAVRPLLQDKQAAIYFFHDGDLLVTWSGPQKAVFESLCSRLYERFCPDESRTLHRYYDFGAHAEDLRLLCKRKLEALKGQAAAAGTAHAGTLSPPTAAQFKAFSEAEEARLYREKPAVLVVEDQLFSRNLMLGLLQRMYKVEAASNAVDGLKLYLECAPDIAFLDIELPGSSGHELAEMIKGFDSKAYLVMVTANNHLDDINRARKNGVKGFVVKPYSKQKILESIDRYINERKAQRRA